MLLRTRRTPSAFIPPCLPSPAERPPSGTGWIHEIKHDGFRMMVRRDAAGVRLLTRNGIDWSARFPLIFEAAGALQGRSFLLDGEAVACDGDGLPVFDRLRFHQQLQEPRVARSLDGSRREWFKVHCDGARLVGATWLATSGALPPPPQRKDLRGLSLARNQSHDAVAPERERGADLFWIGGQVIGARDL